MFCRKKKPSNCVNQRVGSAKLDGATMADNCEGFVPCFYLRSVVFSSFFEAFLCSSSLVALSTASVVFNAGSPAYYDDASFTGSIDR